MKHSGVLYTLLFLTLLSTASAQTYVGLNGGGGMPDEVLFRGALFGERSLGANIALRVEAAYVQRENPSLLTQLPRRRNYIQPVINYLEVPMLFKFQLPLPIVDLYALAGPQIAYGIHLYSTYEEDNRIFTERLDFRRMGIHRLDVGCYVGAGLEKEISRGRRIFIDIRYYLGLHNINANGQEKIFNQGKSFALGFMIPVKSKRTTAGLPK